jgi:cell division protein FtsZ
MFKKEVKNNSEIKVIGIGGAGCNALNLIYTNKIKNVDFIICNTDKQALDNSQVSNKILLGPILTEGLGAGANPEIGIKAAIESKNEIDKKILNENTNVLFIIAGLGGGTGTGGTQVIATQAKKKNIITIGIFTFPFQFEGKLRAETALEAIKKIKELFDTFIIINNDNLRNVYGNIGFKLGFSKSDEILNDTFLTLFNFIENNSKNSFFQNNGIAVIGFGKAKGENRAKNAIFSALQSPFFNGNKIVGAKHIFLHISSGKDEVTIDEIGEINDKVQIESGFNANILLSVGENINLEDSISISMVATGFDYLTNLEYNYFNSIEFYGIKCFKDKQILHLSSDTSDFMPWTIILGDNGTGKTTLLRILDRMQPRNNSIKENFFPMMMTYDNFYHNDQDIEVILNLDNNGQKKYNSFSVGENLRNHKGEGNNNFPFFVSYGASRRMSKDENFSNNEKDNLNETSLFDESIELINAEEWFLQKEWAAIKSQGVAKLKFKKEFNLVKSLLIDILPDVFEIQSKPINDNNSKPILEIKTNYGWVNLRDLSFGYQTITALIVDIASKMMTQYPESENPLSEPVIILIDEIDLHLHPKWQRTVIDKLSFHFPKAQFIVTAHSPLIVQAAQDRNANIVVCRKEGDRVVIDNNPESVKGWRIDQILTSDLFDVESSQSIEIEKLRNEKISLLLNKSLSIEDKERLKSIDKKLFSSPVFSSKESINAETLIKKAAELLKK